MGKVYEEIGEQVDAFIRRQRVFFVATAPLAGDGHVNCSPKGLDTLAILDPHTVAYLDLTGSGVETIAHLRENGRIVLMFTALDGPPKIVRLHGRGRVVAPHHADFAALRARFPGHHEGVRSVIAIDRRARVGLVRLRRARVRRTSASARSSWRGRERRARTAWCSTARRRTARASTACRA